MLPISIHVALGFAPSRGMSTPLLRMRGFDYTNQQNSRFEWKVPRTDSCQWDGELLGEDWQMLILQDEARVHCFEFLALAYRW
jgi:hypothetical protein